MLSIVAYGQVGFRNGYVITLPQDTVWGKVKQPKSSEITCKFRHSNGKTVDYSPDEIAEFGFKNNKVYISKKINGKKIFFEYLVKGNLNLYSLKEKKKERYFIENELYGISELKLLYETIYGETGMKLNKLSKHHIELLNKYTAEIPALKSKTDKIDVLEDENLIKIVAQYNKEFCGQKKCDNNCCKIFPRDIYKWGFEVNPVAGFSKFVVGDMAFTTGVIGYYRLPKCGNKLFVKAGFLYSKITEYQELTKQNGFVQFPIQIEARYPVKYFRPKIAWGINLTNLKYLETFYSTTFSAGVDVRLTKKIYLSLNYDLNFEPLFLIIPVRAYSHSLMFGVNFLL
jgi:hypothetical protein